MQAEIPESGEIRKCDILPSAMASLGLDPGFLAPKIITSLMEGMEASYADGRRMNQIFSVWKGGCS